MGRIERTCLGCPNLFNRAWSFTNACTSSQLDTDKLVWKEICDIVHSGLSICVEHIYCPTLIAYVEGVTYDDPIGYHWWPPMHYNVVWVAVIEGDNRRRYFWS